MRRARRLGGEGGFALVELLIASSLMLVILSATLATFTGVDATNREANERAEAQDAVRRETDRLARELRNLAAPSSNASGTVATPGLDEAHPFSLVFRTVDPVGPNSGENFYNVRRVRWCLGSGEDAQLFEQVQRWTTSATPAMPSTQSCPDAAWGNQRVVAERVANRATSPTRPVFLFNATAAADVSHVRTDLLVDVNGRPRPAETRLRGGVHLRNHNRPPTVDFTYEVIAPGKLLLNGSLATDPEGEPLTYVWKDGTQKMSCSGTIVATCSALGAGVRQISLVAVDRALLEGSITKPVNVDQITGGGGG